MLQIRVKYFASVRETLGCAAEAVATQAASLGQLRQELLARGGVYAQALSAEKAIRMALNQEMADESAPLSDGAEVAFFPPVTGG